MKKGEGERGDLTEKREVGWKFENIRVSTIGRRTTRQLMYVRLTIYLYPFLPFPLSIFPSILALRSVVPMKKCTRALCIMENPSPELGSLLDQ
jgi:hypothetical protein